MEVKVSKTAEFDKIFLVSSKSLMNCVDQHDLLLREAETVLDLYHKDWFYDNGTGVHFTPPAIYISNGKVLFINGRHRTVLLARHLKEFPLLLGGSDMMMFGCLNSAEDMETLNKILVKELACGEQIGLPDLNFGDFDAA